MASGLMMSVGRSPVAVRRWPWARDVAILLLALMLALAAQSQTVVSGAVAVDSRWTLAQSPIVVQGNLTVQGGATLTIEAGVTVYMAAGSSLMVQSGSLRAVGSVGQRIRVLSERSRTQGLAAPGDWAHWVFDPGAVNTLLDSVDFEHGQGLQIRGSAPVLNRVDIRNQAGPAISIDLLASPTGVANSASGNALNGIQVPAGDIAGSVRWGLRGIPYVIESGTVSVGASPRVTSVTPAAVEQGSTVTLSVIGTRLAGLASAALDQAGLVLTPFSGGTASQLFMQLQVDPAAPLGPAALRLQVDAGDVVVANAVTVTQALPAITAINPASVLAGAEPTLLSVSGRNYVAGSEILVNSASLPTTVVSATELRATVPRQTATANLQVQVRSPDPLLPGQALLSNAVSFGVLAPVPPLLAVEPTPIALPPDNKSRDVTVRLSKADYRDNLVTVTVADPTKASVTPQTLVIAAGQTSARLSITPLLSGTTSLILDSATLARITLPLFITADFRGANTAYAAPVGVVIETGSPAASTTVTLNNAAVGVAVGAVLTQVSPAALTLGSVSTITITGVAIPAGSQASLVPAAGISLGSTGVSADGSAITLTATVAADAAVGSRRLVVRDALGKDLVFADPARAAVQLLAGLPALASITPNFSTRGQKFELLVRGQNLQQGRLRLSPDSGIQIDSAPVVSADGSALVATLAIAADAPTGVRVVQIVTPAGATDAQASAANSFTIAASVGNPVTPLASALVGVVVEGAASPLQPVQTQTAAPLVGVVLGAGVTDLAPHSGVIGSDVAVVVRGLGLNAVTAVSVVPAAGVTVVQGPVAAADGTALDFTLRVDAGAALGTRRLLLMAADKPLAFARLFDSEFLVAAPVPELDSVSPQVLVAGLGPFRLTVLGRNLRNLSGVRFEPAQGLTVNGTLDASADGLMLGFTATVAADAAPGERVVVVTSAAGDSTLVPQAGNQVRIARQAGPTYKDLASPAVGVVNGAQDTLVLAPGSTLAAPLVGVVVEAGALVEAVKTTAAANAVGVLIGPAAQSISPNGWLQGDSGSITVGGQGLDRVISVSLTPASGLLLGSPVANADGSVLTIPLAVAPDAALQARRLRLATAAGEVLFLSADAALLGIGSVPTMSSLSPIVVEQGRSTQVVVRGSRLKGVSAAAFEPAAGMVVAGPLLWAQDALGETLTVPVRVDMAAPTGLRVLRLLVPGGATPAQASPVNSFTVITPQ